MTHGHRNSVGIECGTRGGIVGGGQRGKNWDNCNRITIKNDLKTLYKLSDLE